MPPSLLDYTFIDFHLENPITQIDDSQSQEGYIPSTAQVAFNYNIGVHETIKERYFFELSAQIISDHTKIKTTLVGIFQFEDNTDQDYKETMIRHQGVATLYSVLRGYVGMMTTSRIFVLPNIMPADIVKNVEELKKKELETQEITTQTPGKNSPKKKPTPRKPKQD